MRQMPVLAVAIVLATMSADTLPRIAYEVARLTAEVDSAPPAAPACSRDRYTMTGWREVSPGIEGIRYSLPAGVPSPDPYDGSSIVAHLLLSRSWRFVVLREYKKPEFGAHFFPTGWRGRTHDYSWCRELVGRRWMVVTAYKLTWLDQGAPGQVRRSYVVHASWELGPAWWLTLGGDAQTAPLQRELLAIIRTFRIDLAAAAREPRLPWPGDRYRPLRGPMGVTSQ